MTSPRASSAASRFLQLTAKPEKPAVRERAALEVAAAVIRAKAAIFRKARALALEALEDADRAWALWAQGATGEEAVTLAAREICRLYDRAGFL